ncbi:hypothetical protein BGX24_000236 [Mortierella sp. AD032]|nr:hypothetical protein BGX24_000236 [Mortierella sp. AD032]
MPTAHDHEATLETSRAGTPTPTFSPRPITRRPAFTLGLPWRPQSEYFSQGSPGVQTSLSKSQKRFIRAFPELADIAKVPAAYCLPCLATPPQTPPPEHLRTPGSTTMSPSNTLSTLTSSALSTTSSTTTLACPGHFHDYSCALEREILWQGTLYVAATHVCFYGKHFGKTVKVIIDYRDLIMIEREKKMGVFPSSIRLRVAITSSDQSSSAPRHSQDNKSTTNKDSAVVDLSGTQTTKDYVLTSLMSREQAFADIERNWQAHRQFQTTTCIDGLLTPQTESPGGSEKNLTGLINGESGAGSGFGIDSRFRSRGMLDMHKVPRTYSVITDEAFSSSENLNRPHLRERASTSLIRPSTPTSHDTISSWVAAAAVATSGSDFPVQPNGNPIVSFEGRRGSVASVGSSDKQEPTSGLIGFLQRRSSLVHKWKKSESGGRGDNFSDSDSDAAQDHGEDITRLPLDASAVSATVATAQQFIVQDPSVLAAQRQVDSLRSSTPPPTLISPSLTTTKVSRSLSTVQMDAKPGSMHGMTNHTRDESSDALLVISNDNDTSRVASPVISTPTLHPRSERLPSDPVTCGCSRHYKNAVVSTVVPLPVDLCFEILFSAAGAGLGDKLGCDTHRLKDGSTDILIMPWLHEDQPQGSNRPDWEDRQRKLEYSVSFKVPMLAKTSTACFEVQKVTQFSPFAILVHSESKTPNVPYGEHFSTVNQICMTWESEGRTRIKCFTEVKFKRSIMWSSKVEAGSLEGSGGFYKEFIRQLEQLVESNRDQLICSYEARLLASLSTSNPPGDVNDPAMSTAECISGSEETLLPFLSCKWGSLNPP